MGGERENTVSPKDKAEVKVRAGKDNLKIAEPVEIKESNIRFHENVAERAIHFHDDANNIKVAVPTPDWWAAWEKLQKPSAGMTESWSYADSVNNSVLTIDVQAEFDDTTRLWTISADLELYRAVLGDTFKALQDFTTK